jgi:hypothetical protein
VLEAELRHSGKRLDVLAAGDTATALRAVLSWSYRHLDNASARMFRLLGLHPGPDVPAPAAASLAGMPPAETRRVLRQLTDAHLLTEHLPGGASLGYQECLKWRRHAFSAFSCFPGSRRGAASNRNGARRMPRPVGYGMIRR